MISWRIAIVCVFMLCLGIAVAIDENTIWLRALVTGTMLSMTVAAYVHYRLAKKMIRHITAYLRILPQAVDSFHRDELTEEEREWLLALKRKIGEGRIYADGGEYKKALQMLEQAFDELIEADF